MGQEKKIEEKKSEAQHYSKSRGEMIAINCLGQKETDHFNQMESPKHDLKHRKLPEQITNKKAF